MTRKCALLPALGASLAICASIAPGARADSLDWLRAEGVTLYLRHAAAEWSDQAVEIGSLDPAKLDAKSCAGKRQLTEEGRLQAQAVRAALQGLGVTQVETSAAGLCRAFETARLIGGSTRIVEGLTPAPGRVPSVRAQGEAIERIVRAGERGKGLRIIVGDYEAVQALFGVTLGEGDGLVLKVEADNVAPVARIRASEWNALQPVASGERPVSNRKF